METLAIAAPGGYITFQISGKYFAIPADRVREMMPCNMLVPWASGEPGLLGAVRSCGRMIPVFDLRVELSLKPRLSSRRQCLLIVHSNGHHEFGFTVDKVTDVIQVRSHDIRNAAIIGHGRVRSIVNIDRVLNQERLIAAAFSSISRSSA